MDPARWQQIRQIFEQIVDKSPSHRDDFLEMVCDGDTDLQQQVQALLSAHDELQQEASDEAAIPKAIGDYTPVLCLGTGGMGVVYRATHAQHGDVALKLLPGRVVADSVASQRFFAEAEALRDLTHPALCQFYDAFTVDGYAVLAMELFEGQELAELIAGNGLPLPLAITVVSELAGALELAHQQGIIHRDIKPSNVLLGSDGAVKLIDFGIAKFADRKLTATGQIIGTPSYMSPEQWRGQPLDERSDLWSLGTLLYEMLTGQVAFAGESLGDTAKLILESEPTALPGLSVDGLDLHPLADLVAAMLAKHPAERLGSCADLQQRLKRLPGAGEG